MGPYAPLQQTDDFAWEAGKVYQDALVSLEALKVILCDLQSVKEVGIILAGGMDPQYLRQWKPVFSCCFSICSAAGKPCCFAGRVTQDNLTLLPSGCGFASSRQTGS
jgi:hypothetical protein